MQVGYWCGKATWKVFVGVGSDVGEWCKKGHTAGILLALLSTSEELTQDKDLLYLAEGWGTQTADPQGKLDMKNIHTIFSKYGQQH